MELPPLVGTRQTDAQPKVARIGIGPDHYVIIPYSTRVWTRRSTAVELAQLLAATPTPPNSTTPVPWVIIINRPILIKSPAPPISRVRRPPAAHGTRHAGSATLVAVNQSVMGERCPGYRTLHHPGRLPPRLARVTPHAPTRARLAPTGTHRTT